MLRLCGIKKDYEVAGEKIPALKGITLDFRRNEFVSVLGPSGCGKTTLMNIVGGLDKYSDGDLMIDGKSTTCFEDGDWDNYRNKRIGFIFQSYNLIPHLTVLGNVELALTISGISKAERAQRAKEAVEKVGLGDQLHKKPNQLSGGQMQRVAIARALVNSPDILLADEPTGALDTVTSEQIMELIREVAGEKLVIMVTHNSELAERYSSRLIKMRDGLILSDSDPYDSDSDRSFQNELEQIRAVAEIDEKNKKVKKKPVQKKEKTAMSFLTALSLSLRNLLTKKGRTIMTSIAGSIGIIGIALILAVSNGMNIYIAKTSADTLSSNPVVISESGFDMTQAMEAMSGSEKLEKFPNAQKVFVEEGLKASDLLKKNKITAEYIEYIRENIGEKWCSDILYKTGQEINLYAVKAGETGYSKLETKIASGLMGKRDIMQLMLKNEFVTSQYDALAGRLPAGKNEIVLVVDEYNKVSDNILTALGIKATGDDVKEFDFSDLLTRKFKVPLNDNLYSFSEDKFLKNSPADIDFDKAVELEIVGIVRINEATTLGVMSTGVGYTEELYTYLQEQNLKSEIVRWMNDNDNMNPLTNLPYADPAAYNTALRTFGGVEVPNEVSIYPLDYEGKDKIKAVLNEYNASKEKEDKIIYTDMSAMMTSVMTNMVDVTSYVLIGFTAISLIVSSIMIGIITYVSVLERTKEIGILRSIGARKKDISRVFNAETVIIGFCSGVIGVLVSLLLTIPINLIISALAGVVGIAQLSIWHVLILIAISVCLTLLSGLIPALKAARRDPVKALRTE